VVSRRVQLFLVIGLVLIAIGLVAAFTFTEPTVVSIDNRWGTISEDTAEIRTAIVVDNPNPIGVPPLLNLHYEVRLNQITFAVGDRQGVGFPPGTSTLELSTRTDNSKIADWWVTHVVLNERSTMTIDPSISVRWLPVEVDLPSEREPVTTDVLEPINNEGPATVKLIHEPHLIIEDQNAKWGQPTSELTPIDISTTITNRFSAGSTVENFTYRLSMNEVVVGNGTLN
jgi:LEA14-like dessication related protein